MTDPQTTKWKCIYSPSWWSKYLFCKEGERGEVFQIRNRSDAAEVCQALGIALPEGGDQ